MWQKKSSNDLSLLSLSVPLRKLPILHSPNLRLTNEELTIVVMSTEISWDWFISMTENAWKAGEHVAPSYDAIEIANQSRRRKAASINVQKEFAAVPRNPNLPQERRTKSREQLWVPLSLKMRRY